MLQISTFAQLAHHIALCVPKYTESVQHAKTILLSSLLRTRAPASTTPLLSMDRNVRDVTYGLEIATLATQLELVLRA